MRLGPAAPLSSTLSRGVAAKYSQDSRERASLSRVPMLVTGGAAGLRAAGTLPQQVEPIGPVRACWGQWTGSLGKAGASSPRDGQLPQRGWIEKHRAFTGTLRSGRI